MLRLVEIRAEAVLEAFGLSASTVSRRFKRATVRKLRELTERRLESYDLVAMPLGDKTFAEDETVGRSSARSKR